MGMTIFIPTVFLFVSLADYSAAYFWKLECTPNVALFSYVQVGVQCMDLGGYIILSLIHFEIIAMCFKAWPTASYYLLFYP